MLKSIRVLGVEDNEHKWTKIEAVVRTALQPAAPEIVRAADQHSGRQRLASEVWDLLLLDISLDIKSGASRSGRGAHDYTGGLKLAGYMFYLRKEVPTIIVTGFDAFPSGRASHEKDVILGLEDVEREAQKYLGNHLIGTLRYGSTDWQDALAGLLRRRFP